MTLTDGEVGVDQHLDLAAELVAEPTNPDPADRFDARDLPQHRFHPADQLRIDSVH